MNKISVYCGQNLQITDLFKVEFDEKALTFAFPEGEMGAEGLRNLARSFLISDVNYITRYSTILNELGNMVFERVIQKEQVKIHLLSDDRNNWSEHSMDDDGILNTPWPYGCLE